MITAKTSRERCLESADEAMELVPVLVYLFFYTLITVFITYTDSLFTHLLLIVNQGKRTLLFDSFIVRLQPILMIPVIITIPYAIQLKSSQFSLTIPLFLFPYQLRCRRHGILNISPCRPKPTSSPDSPICCYTHKIILLTSLYTNCQKNASLF